MGEVIRRSAAREAIVADLDTTMRNAKARGGSVAARSEERLGVVLALHADLEPKRTHIERELATAESVVAAHDADADDLVGALADEYWNLIGRPANDPVYSTIVPGGIATYTKGAVDDQPAAMEVFATLLESGLETRVPAEKRAAWAAQVRESSTALGSAIDAATPLRTRRRVMTGVAEAIARTGQKELVKLKRQLLVDGMSEADIHTIIPDRPRPRPAPPAPPAPPTSPEQPTA
jgi:hypothetical protein